MKIGVALDERQVLSDTRDAQSTDSGYIFANFIPQFPENHGGTAADAGFFAVLSDCQDDESSKQLSFMLKDYVSDVGVLYDFRTEKDSFSNCTVMLRTGPITSYDVSRTTSLFWRGTCCFAGGYTGGPGPLQDKEGAVISSMDL